MNKQSQETREFLVQQVTDAERWLSEVRALLDAFDAKAENNVYETLPLALNSVEYQLESRAYADCEGSGNCGLSEYTQLFIVGGVTYVGTLKVEYNRHDKTYYYVDGQEFTYDVC